MDKKIKAWRILLALLLFFGFPASTFGASAVFAETINTVVYTPDSSEAFPKELCIKDYSLPSDVRIVAKVGDELYYGETGAGEYNTVSKAVSYPWQPEGTEIVYWAENTTTGETGRECVATVYNEPVFVQIQEITAYPSAIRFNKYSGNDNPEGSEVTIDGVTYSSEPLSDGSGFILNFPRQEAGSELDVTCNDIHGCRETKDVTISNSEYESGDVLYFSSLKPKECQGFIALPDIGENEIKSCKLKIGGKEAKIKYEKVGKSKAKDVYEYVFDDASYIVYEFSCKYSNSVNKSATLSVTDFLGSTYKRTGKIKNKNFKMKLWKQYSDDDYIYGDTEKNASCIAQYNGKTKKGKANSKGRVNIQTGYIKPGTKITVKTETSEGYTRTDMLKVLTRKGNVKAKKFYNTDTSVSVTVTKASAKDSVILMADGKTYTKKIDGGYIKTKTVSFDIGKKVAGTKITLKYTDSFGKKKCNNKTITVAKKPGTNADGTPVVTTAPQTNNNTSNTTSSDSYHGTVYYTPSGEKYHISRSCPTLSRSRTVYSCSESEAQSKGRQKCKICG